MNEDEDGPVTVDCTVRDEVIRQDGIVAELSPEGGLARVEYESGFELWVPAHELIVVRRP